MKQKHDTVIASTHEALLRASSLQERKKETLATARVWTKQSQCAELSLRRAAGGPCEGREAISLRVHYRSPRGFVLVISLGLVALIMIVTINLARTMIASRGMFSGVRHSIYAYDAAESALETGLLANKGKGPGYEASVKCNARGECKDQNGKTARGINFIDINGSYGSWTIQGRTWCLWSNPLKREECDAPNTYIIPYPGTGTAGNTCDPLGAYPDVNHACNWGKIPYGETATIPLYAVVNPNKNSETYADATTYSYGALGNNDGILDPSEWGLSGIYIKVRTPCKDGSNECEDSARYDLNDWTDDADGVNGPNDTIVLWEMTGTDEDGKRNYLHADATKDADGNPDQKNNTEIHEAAINFIYNTHDEILNGDSKGFDKDGNSTSLLNFLKNMSKPILTLQVITSLKNADGGSIPYLEYQIEVEGVDIPPADMYQTIIGEGYSGNFKQSVEVKKAKTTGVLKFVIQN